MAKSKRAKLTDYVAVTGPLPPSANRLWRVGRGRAYKTAEYRAYPDKLTIVGALADTSAAVQVVIVLGRPDKRRRDLDNRIKPILDALVARSIIIDDTQVSRITAYWSDAAYIDVDVPPGEILVVIAPL